MRFSFAKKQISGDSTFAALDNNIYTALPERHQNLNIFFESTRPKIGGENGGQDGGEENL